MKVAIDTGPLTSGHSVRGIGRYTKELLSALKTKGVDVSRADLSEYDVVHFTSFKPFEISLPFKKPKNTKFVLTMYDLVPLIYPDRYPAGIRGKIKFLINKYLIKRNVDLIITISETSKKDICKFLGIEPKKIKVIYLAPGSVFKKLKIKNLELKIAKQYALPDRFALYVGDVNYNKNIPTLVKACAKLKLPLVICGKQAADVEVLSMDIANLKGPRDWLRYLFGKPHPEIAHYRELSSDFKRNKNIIRLGYVPDSDLVAIYNLASVYVQPSFYEGFGLPVLEAIACQTPVVASKTQALVEIAQAAAVFFDPKDNKDLAKKIKKILEDKTLRSQLRSAGLKVVKNYSWKKTADETLRSYEEIFKL